MSHQDQCQLTLHHETFQCYASDEEHDKHHQRKCNEDRKIQATKDGKRIQWHIIWGLMHGRLITQTCCKESVVDTIDLPQNDVDFSTGLRAIINEHKAIVKILNIQNAIMTDMRLLRFRQSQNLSIKDRRETEAKLLKLHFLTGQATYNMPQETRHNSVGIYVDQTTG